MATPADTHAKRPVERLFTPESVASIDYARDVADPGQFPYTRGIHATGYRGKLWTMRQFAGFGGRHGPQRRFRSADVDGP
jgi:methylmalonyl-CoA mutase N-terminal domain/subunit